MKKYKTIQYLWQRISYWGDKLLTVIFYLLVGVFILSWRFMRWVKEWSWKSFLYVTRGISSHWRAYRLQKRIKYDWDALGKKDYYKELREKDEL
ncbi:hypothetical protein LCGC14_0547800 [marine sediment metagenome]|uniref:Uncharacterized protein n=1 Tax=marine sediment metagenome TaxID=412755 RepID=A0A0F9UZ42_9ZZZZ